MEHPMETLRRELAGGIIEFMQRKFMDRTCRDKDMTIAESIRNPWRPEKGARPELATAPFFSPFQQPPAITSR